MVHTRELPVSMPGEQRGLEELLIIVQGRLAKERLVGDHAQQGHIPAADQFGEIRPDHVQLVRPHLPHTQQSEMQLSSQLHRARRQPRSRPTMYLFIKRSRSLTVHLVDDDPTEFDAVCLTHDAVQVQLVECRSQAAVGHKHLPIKTIYARRVRHRMQNVCLWISESTSLKGRSTDTSCALQRHVETFCTHHVCSELLGHACIVKIHNATHTSVPGALHQDLPALNRDGML